MLRVTRTALRGRSRSAVLAALDAVVPSHRREERESTYLSSARSVSTTAAAATAVVASSTLLANTESLSALLGVGGAGSVFPGLAGSSALALSAANAGPWVGGASLTFLTSAPVIACQAFWAAPFRRDIFDSPLMIGKMVTTFLGRGFLLDCVYFFLDILSLGRFINHSEYPPYDSYN